MAGAASDMPGHGPAAAQAAIDLAHLSRMTFADGDLQREVLDLFDRQALVLVDRMRAGPAAVAKASAHTLSGSARGIGAWRVAQAAEALEAALHDTAATPPAAELAGLLDRLAERVAEARADIARLRAAA